MAVQEAGLSTLGVKFGYAVETTAGDKPGSFKWLERCNTINGLNLSTEIIDASALEDYIARKIAGRQDPGDDWTVTFNYTAEVAAQLKQMISDYNTAKASGLRTWFEVWIPNATNAFYVVAQPPQVLSMPEFSQNALLTIDLTLAVQEYIGDSAALEPAG